LEIVTLTRQKHHLKYDPEMINVRLRHLRKAWDYFSLINNNLVPMKTLYLTFGLVAMSNKPLELGKRKLLRRNVVMTSAYGYVLSRVRGYVTNNKGSWIG
jgi:hypothetical protein